MRYTAAKGTEISTVTDGGEVLHFDFSKGYVEVADDFQEATRVLDAHPKVKRAPKAEKE